MTETEIIDALQREGVELFLAAPNSPRERWVVEAFCPRRRQRSKAPHDGTRGGRYVALSTCAREFGVDVGESLI